MRTTCEISSSSREEKKIAWYDSIKERESLTEWVSEGKREVEQDDEVEEMHTLISQEQSITERNLLLRAAVFF